jgi:predicted HTH transcriptional regulator
MWFIAGVLLGMGSVHIYRAVKYPGSQKPPEDGYGMEARLPVSSGSSAQKEQNLREVLRLFGDHARIRNQDVQVLLGVSPKTARNYFAELEAAGLIAQRGTNGRDVYYQPISTNPLNLRAEPTTVSGE